MKKIVSCLLALCCAAGSLLSLSGCNKSTNNNTIYYLNFKPEIASVYDEIAKTYSKEKGVTLRVTTAASGTYEQTLKSEMANVLALLHSAPLKIQ